MTDVTGPNTTGGAKPRRTAKPKSGFAAVDAEAKILENTAVQGDAGNDLAVSQHGDVSSEKAAERSGLGASGAVMGASGFAAGSEGASGAAMGAAPADEASGGAQGTSARSGGGAASSRSGGDLSEEDSVALAALDAAQERARHVRDWARMRRDAASEAVRTNPIGSSVIVFGAGMILGLLLARR